MSGNNRTVTVGNPTLDPFRAKSYDLGVEWYFAPESLLSLALFYKDVDSLRADAARSASVHRQSVTVCDDSVAIAACGTTAGCSPAATLGLQHSRRPPRAARSKASKSATSSRSRSCPACGATSAPSSTTPVWNPRSLHTVSGASARRRSHRSTDDLTGLSKDAYNATLYFDNKIFSARVAAAYRSDYLTTVPGRNSNDVEGTAETMNIDFSASYNINDQLLRLARGAEPHR